MANKPDHHHHRSSRRLMLVLYFTCVLGIGFATAFLCLSFTKSPSSTVSSIWVLENPPQIQAPSTASRIVQNVSSNQMRNKNDDFLSYIPQSFLLFFCREATRRKMKNMLTSVYYPPHLPIFRRRRYNGSKCRLLRFLDSTVTPYKSKTFSMSSPATAVSTT